MINHDKLIKSISPKSVRKAEKSIPDKVLLSVVVKCFKALGDQTRAKILYSLQRQPLCVRDLSSLVGVSESGVSHQLSMLKKHSLVKVERSGNVMNYSIAYEHVHNLLKEAEYYRNLSQNNIKQLKNEQIKTPTER